MAEEELQTVARILLGMSRDELLELHKKHDSPESFVEFLAQSISATTKHEAGGSFSSALRPIISRGVVTSVERDPATFGRAIAPVMGPALREAVRQSLSEFVRNTEQLLNDSLSVRGLRWRIEALRTGRSFASVALMHSLVYRVEHIYLVHREGGLLLHHEALDPTVEAREPELISAMLTAIRSFVGDAFEAPEDDGLHAFQVGDLSVVVESSQDLTLAAVVRGRVPGFLRESLEDSVQHFQLQFSDELHSFEGETDPFVRASERMRRSLAAKLKDATGSAPRRGRFLLAAASLVVLGLLSFWLWSLVLDRRADDRLITALQDSPGIVVTEVDRRRSGLTVSGLRDSYASAPEEILQTVGSGSRQVDFRFERYSSLDPELVLLRARAQLAPPPTVKLELGEGQVLTARLDPADAAGRDWLVRAERIWPSIVGVLGFSTIGAAALEPQILSIDIAFPIGSSELAPGSLTAIEQLREALVASSGSQPAKVLVRGFDGGRPAQIDNQLMRDRLTTIRRELGNDAALLDRVELGGVISGSLDCEVPCEQVAGLRFSVSDN